MSFYVKNIIVFFALAALVFLFPADLVYAQNVVCPYCILNNIKNMVAYPVFFGLVTIMFIWAGILYLTARGDPAQLQKANKAVTWALVGTVIGLLAVSFESMIRTYLGV